MPYRKAVANIRVVEPKRFSDQIRAAVDASGQSRYALCQAIDLNQGAMSGKAGLSLEVLDPLAEFLGLEIDIKAKGIGRRVSDGERLQEG